MTHNTCIVASGSVHTIGTSQQALVAVVEIVDSTHVFALLTGRRVEFTENAGSMAGLATEIGYNFVLAV